MVAQICACKSAINGWKKGKETTFQYQNAYMISVFRNLLATSAPLTKRSFAFSQQNCTLSGYRASIASLHEMCAANHRYEEDQLPNSDSKPRLSRRSCRLYRQLYFD